MCGISHKRNNLLSALSDGERQKATIAKALAQDTPIIILDEPTAFLDLPARVEIMQLLRHLAIKTQKSVLMYHANGRQVVAIGKQQNYIW